ncbi:hypothetical protein FDP41_009471 [Naegleria fowleri]|uniref:Uncharacterized protein n=1 Tax=Naegleria fowleri TaxID=5763 RepID=A0A6A5B1K7_NAEFO|nr:uncharacterized protein FDP41_009471 [Naegleria fowleri]KAF0972267.1 hypothetical protein FDP41_009471 [Naegleria fowleri]
MALSPVILQMGSDKKASIEKLFEGWAKAFNHSWKFIDRYKCLPLPNWCRNIVMTKDTPLSFSIPDETGQDEGICSLAVTQFLIDKHNEVIEKVGKLFNKNVENTPIEISSRFVSKHHLIVFNIEEELVSVIAESKLNEPTLTSNNTNGDKQKSSARHKFDYERIEQFILTKYLSGKPKIKLELEGFLFLNETRYSTGFGDQIGGPVSELKRKIKQVEIPTDIKQAIILEMRANETSLDIIQACLRQVEECISFLQAISSSNNLEDVEKMSITDYLHNILLVDPSTTSNQPLCNISNIMIHVKLCHLLSLWQLLENELSPGSTIESSIISNRYKRAIPSSLLNHLKEFKEKLSLTDLSILTCSIKELLLSYFTNETLDSEIPLKQMLEITPAVENMAQVSKQTDNADSNSGGKKLGDFKWLQLLSDELKTAHLFETIEVFDLKTRKHTNSLSVENFFPNYLCIEENYDGHGRDALLIGREKPTVPTMTYSVCKIDLHEFLSNGDLSIPFIWENKLFTRAPLGMCIVTKAQRELVVCDPGNCFLRVLNLKTGELTRNIEIGLEPCDVCVVSDEELVVSWAYSKAVVKVIAKKNSEAADLYLLCGDRSRLEHFVEAYSVIFDSQNNQFIVSDPEFNTSNYSKDPKGMLQLFSRQRRPVKEYGNSSSRDSLLKFPKGLCLHRETHELFVCDFGDAHVLIIE